MIACIRRPRCRGALAAVVLVATMTTGCATSGRQRPASLGVAEPSGDSQVARIKLDSYYFEPSRLIVQVGRPVRLVLDNGTMLTGHDFSIFAPDAGLEVDAYVPARQQVTVQFVPRQLGEFTFYCNIDDHTDKGMTGTLVVVEELGPLPGKP